MTKPQTAEPSMEDILASIRKMISEERLGPRPIPDQIARSNYSNGSAARTAKPDPQPKQRAEPQQPTRAPASPDRGTPEFSSLSDALKAASGPAADQRRSLDEKIADMLDKDPATEAPADPLARFAANRSAAAPTIPQARTASPSKSAPTQFPRPGADPLNGRKADDNPILKNGAAPAQPVSPQPHVGLNGSVGKPAGSNGGTVVPLSGEPAARDQNRASPASDNRSAGAPKTPSDAQRVIAMPTRQPTAFGHAGTTPASSGLNGKGMNGGKVSSIGPRLDVNNGSAPVRSSSLLGDVDRVSDKIADELMEKVVGRLTPKQPAKPVAPEPTKAEAGQAPTTPGAERPEPSAPAAGAPETEEKPVFVKATEALSDPDAQTPEPKTAAEASEPAAAPGDRPTDLTPAQLLHAVAKESVAGQTTPSEALIDAVVDMVHKEPDSLSVFTSGSAFIHGVNEHDEPHHAVPAAGGAPAKGLDRSAAELLRPMLRQWLADNMPRIVEEALRSELMSSTGSSDKDTDKG
jgi:cell pole-organizing protein PopZ